MVRIFEQRSSLKKGSDKIITFVTAPFKSEPFILQVQNLFAAWLL